MDKHFSVLGLPRGSSETDLKKAYRKKALELHPDRNPNGGDLFKMVNEAYEALQKHYKSNMGMDIPTNRTTTTETAYHTYKYTTTTTSSSTNARPSEPLVSDAELFRDEIPGGWSGATSKRQDPLRYPFRQRRATNNGESGQESARTSQPGSDAAAQMANKYFEDLEKRKKRMSDDVQGPAPPPRRTSSPQRDNTFKPYHAKLAAEWEEMRRNQAHEKENKDFLEEAERRMRREALAKETAEEWNRIQEEMNDKRLAESAREARVAAAERVQQQHKASAVFADLNRERRELKKELFRRRIPEVMEMKQMTEQELFVLEQALSDAREAAARLLRERLRPDAVCCVCHASPKSREPNCFTCGHETLCSSCRCTVLCCPVCGDENTSL